MNSLPGPVRQGLKRGSAAGAVLGVLAILVFIGLYVALGSAGVSNVARLFIALCAPPVLLAVLVGGYMMWSRRKV